MNLNFMKILLDKEFKQILKDKSVFVIIFFLPLMLVVIYGSAIRMEVKPVVIGIVSSNQSLVERRIVQAFEGSDYFDVTLANDFSQGQKLLADNKISAFLYFQNDFAANLASGKAEVMLYANGVEAQMSQLAANYAKLTLSQAISELYPQEAYDRIKISSRNWFNESNESVWFLMSGQYVSIVTLMSIFLGSFVIAREYDRRTIESLAATNVSAFEIILSKVLAYYFLSLWGMLVILILGQLGYGIPLRGSIFELYATLSLYILEMICLGVFISSAAKTQFNAVEIAVIIGFLPTVLLSGMIFDLRSVVLLINVIGSIIPPTYEVKAMRSIMLSGIETKGFIINATIQAFWTLLFFYLSVRKLASDCKRRHS